MTRTVTVYVRPGCHLCDEAINAARPVLDELRLGLALVDIEGDDALHARYLERIPVFCFDGVELFDFFFDATVLRNAAGA